MLVLVLRSCAMLTRWAWAATPPWPLALTRPLLGHVFVQEARAVVEADLGRPIDEIFSKWGEKPIGSASLAQVCVLGGWRVAQSTHHTS